MHQQDACLVIDVIYAYTYIVCYYCILKRFILSTCILYTIILTRTPHVHRKVTTTKSNPGKTIEIFEGMTLVELAKRSGNLLSSL